MTQARLHLCKELGPGSSTLFGMCRAPIAAGALLKVLLQCAVKHGIVHHVLLLLRVNPPRAGTALGSRVSLSQSASQGRGWVGCCQERSCRAFGDLLLVCPRKAASSRQQAAEQHHSHRSELIQRVHKIKHALLHLAHATIPASLLLWVTCR